MVELGRATFLVASVIKIEKSVDFLWLHTEKNGYQSRTTYLVRLTFTNGGDFLSGFKTSKERDEAYNMILEKWKASMEERKNPPISHVDMTEETCDSCYFYRHSQCNYNPPALMRDIHHMNEGEFTPVCHDEVCGRWEPKKQSQAVINF